MTSAMTSRGRVLAALGHREADRVPLFLPVTMHGAAEVGLSLGDYYRDAEAVARGQILLRRKFDDDVVYPFFYGAIEHEAFGGEVAFFDDGPPNAVGTVVSSEADIAGLEPPRVADVPALRTVLRTIEILRAEVGAEALIVAVVMSPFSLPVMQMGFSAYLDLLHDRPGPARRLLAVNEEFCVAWANAQLSAGADAIGYFDPLSSPTVLDPAVTRAVGVPLMARTMSRIQGPVAALMASGRTLPLLADLATTPAVLVGAGNDEDLADVKAAARGRLAVMGNLNALEMRRWSASDAEAAVRTAIAAAGPGGGFILSDAHGEIPMQVPDDVLLAGREAVDRWGRYPLTWAGEP